MTVRAGDDSKSTTNIFPSPLSSSPSPNHRTTIIRSAFNSKRSFNAKKKLHYLSTKLRSSKRYLETHNLIPEQWKLVKTKIGILLGFRQQIRRGRMMQLLETRLIWFSCPCRRRRSDGRLMQLVLETRLTWLSCPCRRRRSGGRMI
jgi:hypothetical protein